MGSELVEVISELLALVKDEASSGPTLEHRTGWVHAAAATLR